MKTLIRLCIISLIPLSLLLSGCSMSGTGEVIGVQGRTPWFPEDPYGMIYVKMGSYNMGPNDQDVPWAMTTTSKTVSIHPFWMDQTEITNNEYRQFVYWVRDSIAKFKLGDINDLHLNTEDMYGDPIDPPTLNWDERIIWDDDDARDALQDMYLPVEERFYRRKEIDTRKLMFTYYWIDLRQAASKSEFGGEKRRSFDFDNQKYDGDVTNWSVEKDADGIKVDRSNVGVRGPIENRKSYIMMDVVNVYPDTLCWVSDFTYSYNEPMAKMYFWHPAYDHYPVVGVSWKQCTAFSIWRTQLLNSMLARWGDSFVQDYRLPTESEWEYAARGGLRESMYPWGGYYTRNPTGCFIANFKPLRGNYIADGGFYPIIVASNDPNAFDLYDMAGNVAEWTSNAFDEAAYMFTDDLNPDYLYDALPDDPPARKRKVIRGGSWKDIGYYLQCGSRTYEYQDTAKSYIGFRCVRTYLGREYNDQGRSQVY